MRATTRGSTARNPRSAPKARRLAAAIKAYEQRELEKARALLLDLRREFRDDATIAVYTAWTHDSLGLEEEAVAHYEAAIALGLSGEKLRGAYLGLGSTLRALGHDEDSERIFRRGLERFPGDRALRAFRALLAYNRGRPREAVESLVKLLLETTGDARILRYRRALAAYAEDLDRSWLRT
jgi:tetratricopeptide (TPR) repeat protein